MPYSLRSINIVLVGENLPVDVVDVHDFSVPGYSLREELRVPVALQARGGPFSLHVVPDRFQVAVELHDREVGQHELQALASCAGIYLEYAGRRSLTAVGHNVHGSVPVEPGSKEHIMRHFVDYGFLRSYTEVESPVVDLRLIYSLGAETRLTHQIQGGESPDEFKLDFNFHFRLKSDDSLSPTEAIEELPQSARLAGEKLGAFQQLAAEQETAES